MDKLGWIFLVLLTGALLPVQAGLNSRIGKEIQSPVWASLISFAIGLVLLIIYVIVTRQKMQVSGTAQVPYQHWLAGGLGAFYITVSILAFPRLGAALTFSLLVAGQLIVSLLLDHFQILVQQQQPISLARILGFLLVISGVILIRKF